MTTDHQRSDRSDWMTVEATAQRLGTSTATVKRRIADGKPVRLQSGRSVTIEAEMLERAQGHEYRVRIVGDAPPPPALTAPLMLLADRSHSEAPPALGSAQDSAQTDVGGADIRAPQGQSPPEAAAMAFVAELSAVRQMADERIARLLTLERENAVLAAERDAAQEAARIASESAAADETIISAQATAVEVLTATVGTLVADRDRLAAELAAERSRSWWGRLLGR
jgi:hypothetical protein